MSIGHNGGPPIDWKQYGGFIVEARAARNHPVVGYGKPVKPADDTRGFCFSVNEAWRYLLHECNYKEGRVNNGGRMMVIRRGELTGAVSWLAHEWNWTPKTVRRFLDKLEADGMISRFAAGPDDSRVGTEKGNHGGKQAAIISVCNYDKFNPSQLYEGQAYGPAEGKQGASRGQAEGKSINKETREEDKKVYGQEGQTRGRDYWSNAMAVPGAYNPDEGVLRDEATGALTLVNGTRQTWLERFGDAESLDLALMQAAAYVQPNAYKPLKLQIEAQLAKQLASVKERGKRYEAAKQSKPQAETPEQRKKRLFAQAQDEMRGRK